MATITEWEFTADVASQINEILRDRPDLPFSNARCETRKRGTQQRRDLTIYDRENQIILTGEVKLPDKPDGRSPFQESLVLDAHEKANNIGVEHFFTWNVNKCVLWKTFEQGKSITERDLEFFNVLPAPIREADQLLDPRVKDQIKTFLVRFLERCAALFSGAEPMQFLPLDARFVYIWEADLDPLVTQTLAAIHSRYETDKAFRIRLDKWMRDEQGWTLSRGDEAILRDNLERAAKLSCYVLANKIVFYKALRRRFPRMKALRIPADIASGDELKQLLNESFDHATRASHDYETVFQNDFGDTLPLLNNAAVESWRALSLDTDKFDFTEINYEVMGLIFERLLSTTERHKFGQHYTRSEVVDLINAFCIREPNSTVLDPACGGGTFLVRAYQRKSDLAEGRLPHQQLVQQLYGLDISAYPVHLTTINLATRDLIDRANYPLIARKDFFKTKPNDAIFHIPLGGGQQATWTEIPKVNVIVGNPPYVRQEKINEYYGKTYKRFLQDLANNDAAEAQLSGRSDILCYFFTHGFAFLEDSGYMGLLTSSTWLDTAYGFRLQNFLLDNFEIIAIFESNCEPWFTGARVTTAATILRRQTDPTKRAANNVKFVWIKKPIADFLTYSKTEDDRRQTFEDIRQRIENLTANEETEAWRVRVVNQGDLYRLGCLPFDISEDEEAEGDGEEAEDETRSTKSPQRPQVSLPHHHGAEKHEYIGYKWGIFLRAPNVFFTLLRRYGGSFVAVGQVAEIRRGITSGCDDFFFPYDVTDEALKISDDREFKEHYGLRRAETRRIRVVKAGDGSVHLIEAKYLEPEIHSVMGLDSVGISLEKLRRKALLTSESKAQLKGTELLKYIKWGEREGFSDRSTIEGRIGTGKQWYDITTDRRGDVLWCKAHQYRHIAWLNSHHLVANCRMYDLFMRNAVRSEELCAILNSTVVALTKAFFGRYVGREGNLDTEVLDVKMMLIPDPRKVTPAVRGRLKAALESMCKRQALPLVDVDSNDTNWTGELALADRQDLDDAVLELLGIEEEEERTAIREELYEAITELYRQIRIAERKMQRHRSATARGGRPTAHSIAEEIWDDLETPPVHKTLLNFVPDKVRTKEIYLPAGRARIVRPDLFQPGGVQIGEHFLELADPFRSLFVLRLVENAIFGKVGIPVDPTVCDQALTDYDVAIERLTEQFRDLATAYTADEILQERVVTELFKRLKIA